MQARFLGSTGLIELDSRGERSHFSLDIRQLSSATAGSVVTVGRWTTREGLLWRGAERAEDVALGNGEGGLNAFLRAKREGLVIATVEVRKNIQDFGNLPYTILLAYTVYSIFMQKLSNMPV